MMRVDDIEATLTAALAERGCRDVHCACHQAHRGYLVRNAGEWGAVFVELVIPDPDWDAPLFACCKECAA